MGRQRFCYLFRTTVGFAANSARALYLHTVACIYSSQQSSARTMMRRRARSSSRPASCKRSSCPDNHPSKRHCGRRRHGGFNKESLLQPRTKHGQHRGRVGFDMDYTLAQYNEAFDMLAFEGAKDELATWVIPAKRYKN